MNTSLNPLPPVPVPRLNSLLHRLQHAPGAKKHNYFDQLMAFLDNPPPDMKDRWKEGAKMCAEWGITCTGASVWRLYRSHALEWRMRLVDEMNPVAHETPENMEKKVECMAALRRFELLSHPQTTPHFLLSLFRIEVRKQSLTLARKRLDWEAESKRLAPKFPGFASLAKLHG